MKNKILKAIAWAVSLVWIVSACLTRESIHRRCVQARQELLQVQKALR